MVLKPTALVFSTIVGGTAFLCMVFMKRLRIQWREPFFLGWIPMLSMWALVWLRTWLLTGLPVTSVFYSIWNKLGFVVRYPDVYKRQVEYSFKQLEELELAYAITIHKSQGSEYPAVVIPIYSGPRMLMTRNLIYTAVTRAKKCVCLVGRCV